MNILEVEGLTTVFDTPAGPRAAIEHVGFSLSPREILGIVGESGSGKSVTALSLLGLIDPQTGRVTAGRALFDGRDLLSLPRGEIRKIRGKRISMIFQEPLSALDPCYTIGDQIVEVFAAHGEGAGRGRRNRAIELLRLVHIADPEGVARRYPHEISGGMRQRAMIAMALAYTPDILIADEPTTALDVTIQAQVLNLIDNLRRELGLAVILITHDMGVIAQYAERLVVMYAGRVVETGPVAEIFASPKHPYTRGLLASVPNPGERWRTGARRLAEVPGTIPTITDDIMGCRFAPRCALRIARCIEEPPLERIGSTRASACWRSDEVS